MTDMQNGMPASTLNVFIMNGMKPTSMMPCASIDLTFPASLPNESLVLAYSNDLFSLLSVKSSAPRLSMLATMSCAESSVES